MVSTASLLGDRYLWEVVENKPAKSLVVSLGKTLSGMPPPLCGRQVARPEEGWAPPSVLAQDSLLDKYNQNKLVICSSPTATATAQKTNKNKTIVSMLAQIYQFGLLLIDPKKICNCVHTIPLYHFFSKHRVSSFCHYNGCIIIRKLDLVWTS